MLLPDVFQAGKIAIALRIPIQTKDGGGVVFPAVEGTFVGATADGIHIRTAGGEDIFQPRETIQNVKRVSDVAIAPAALFSLKRPT